jgi:hypothetical protein
MKSLLTAFVLAALGCLAGFLAGRHADPEPRLSHGVRVGALGRCQGCPCRISLVDYVDLINLLPPEAHDARACLRGLFRPLIAAADSEHAPDFLWFSCEDLEASKALFPPRAMAARLKIGRMSGELEQPRLALRSEAWASEWDEQCRADLDRVHPDLAFLRRLPRRAGKLVLFPKGLTQQAIIRALYYARGWLPSFPECERGLLGANP